MNVIWDKAASDEGSTVESIREELAAEGGELALPSVRTMLSILQAKKYVGRRKVGRRHVYEAKVTRAESRSKAVVDLVDRSFGGSATDLLETLIRLRIAGKAEWERAYSRVRSGSRGN